MFRIGFPLDAEAKSHCMIVNVIRSYYHTCLGCGYSNELPKDSGAKFVWEKTPLAFRKYKRLQFAIFPEARRTPTTTPATMFTEGNSDFAACALALAQNQDYDANVNAPLILISCAYDLDPNYSHENIHSIPDMLHHIALSKVTTTNATTAAQSLLNKWNVACQCQALALVLHETDAQILHKKLEEQTKNSNDVPPILSLQQDTFHKLAKKKHPTPPALVSAKTRDLPCLANALVIRNMPRILKFAILTAIIFLLVAGLCYHILVPPSPMSPKTLQTDCGFFALYKSTTDQNKIYTTNLLVPDNITLLKNKAIYIPQVEPGYVAQACIKNNQNAYVYVFHIDDQKQQLNHLFPASSTHSLSKKDARDTIPTPLNGWEFEPGPHQEIFIFYISLTPDINIKNKLQTILDQSKSPSKDWPQIWPNLKTSLDSWNAQQQPINHGQFSLTSQQVQNPKITTNIYEAEVQNNILFYVMVENKSKDKE